MSSLIINIFFLFLLQKPIFTLKAHDKEVSAFSFNPHIPNYIATASADKTIKLWDISENRPSLLHTYQSPSGRVFCANFCPDQPFSLAVGGGSASVHVLNTLTIGAVERRFAKDYQNSGGRAGNVSESVVPNSSSSSSTSSSAESH
jgi:WD40 repeat protein